jgi:hypothetical protein
MSRSPSPSTSLRANMNGSRLSACCTKANGVRINGGRIKAVDTENCHVDVVGAVRVSFGGLTARLNAHGTSSCPWNSIALISHCPAHAEAQLIGHRTYVRVTNINSLAARIQREMSSLRHSVIHESTESGVPRQTQWVFEIETREFQNEPVLRN